MVSGQTRRPDLPHIGDVLPRSGADAVTMTDTQPTTTPAQLAEAARALWDSIHAGDVEAVLASFDPDITWVNDESGGPWAGTFQGVDAVAGMVLEFQMFFDGTFAQEVIDIATSGRRIVSVIRETATKGGHAFVNDSVWIAEVVDGRTTAMHTLSLDSAPARRFWAAVEADVPA